MKSIKNMFCLAVCAAMSFAAGKSNAQMPMAPLAIAGTFTYNTNDIVDTNTIKLKTQTYSFVGKDLINLLIASEDVSNTVVDVTTSNGIPAGSYLVINLNTGGIIVTNKNGFSFPLAGIDFVEFQFYNYGGFTGNGGSGSIVSSFSLTNGVNRKTHKPLPATETDNVRLNMSFNDGISSGFEIDHMPTVFNWTASQPSGGSQQVTLSLTTAGTGFAGFKGFDGIAGVSITGAGSSGENVSSGDFPFYIWWFF
jgi:hypothetical protein